MPSGRDSFRRNRVAPFVLFYFIMLSAAGCWPALYLFPEAQKSISSRSGRRQRTCGLPQAARTFALEQI